MRRRLPREGHALPAQPNRTKSGPAGVTLELSRTSHVRCTRKSSCVKTATARVGENRSRNQSTRGKNKPRNERQIPRERGAVPLAEPRAVECVPMAARGDRVKRHPKHGPRTPRAQGRASALSEVNNACHLPFFHGCRRSKTHTSTVKGVTAGILMPGAQSDHKAPGSPLL